MNNLKLILDMNVVNRYNQYYFSQHPKAKKKQVKEVKLQIKDISDYIPLHILENGGAQDYILEALFYYMVD